MTKPKKRRALVCKCEIYPGGEFDIVYQLDCSLHKPKSKKPLPPPEWEIAQGVMAIPSWLRVSRGKKKRKPKVSDIDYKKYLKAGWEPFQIDNVGGIRTMWFRRRKRRKRAK